MALRISRKVRLKLAEKHGVTEDDILQCFTDVKGKFIGDTREEHKTNPPTYWFISETDRGKKLKVIFMADPETLDVTIKSAYPPDNEEMRIYEKYGKK